MEPEPEVEEAGEQRPDQEVKSLNHHSLYYTYLQRYFVTFESASHFVHMHSNGYTLHRFRLFLVAVKPQALPSKPLEIKNVLEPIEVKGKKKSTIV